MLQDLQRVFGRPAVQVEVYILQNTALRSTCILYSIARKKDETGLLRKKECGQQHLYQQEIPAALVAAEQHTAALYVLSIARSVQLTAAV